MYHSSFTSAIVKVLYGIDVAEKNDSSVAMMEKNLEAGEAFVPGTYYVEFLPFLRYVPAWMPGAGFQKRFAAYRYAAEWVRKGMVDKTKKGMVGHCLAGQPIIGQSLNLDSASGGWRNISIRSRTAAWKAHPGRAR